MLVLNEDSLRSSVFSILIFHVSPYRNSIDPLWLRTRFYASLLDASGCREALGAYNVAALPLKCIGGAQDGCFFPVAANEHHASGQAVDIAAWDVHGGMAGGVEGSGVEDR